MIAVFCISTGEFNQMELTPKKMFLQINKVSDISGRKFTAVIKTKGFSRHNSEIQDAYWLLKHRQPELFDEQ